MLVMHSMVFYLVMDLKRENLDLDVSKRYSGKMFTMITLFGVLISAIINFGLYSGITWLLAGLSKDAANQLPQETISWAANHLHLLFHNFYVWVVPAVTGGILLCGWLLWIILRLSIGRTLAQKNDQTAVGSSKDSKKRDFVDQKIEQDRKRRLFLHSLSILQRDGRLLDFFHEDLSLYDDGQIGAAVRSIQEDCKKTIKKYIDPKPVLDAEEGEIVRIEPGFDIDAITLVGNVSGEPPFEGILKHGGWKAGKKEIPKLSDIQDSGIIVPAEVEIQG